MTLKAFIAYVKRNKLKFIDYCEILIDDRGHIFIVNPSHQKSLVRLASIKSKMTQDEICKEIPIECDPGSYLADKYNIIMVWYNRLCVPLNVNDVQIEALRELRKHGIISNVATINCCREYHVQKWRDRVFSI